MPELISNLVVIKIADYDLPVVYSRLVVEQPVRDHHCFSFVWSAGTFKADTDLQLEVVNKYIGKHIIIQLEPSNIFNGIITEITVDEKNSSSHTFIISGYSPSYLLEDSTRSGSFYKKTLEQMAQTVFEGIPENVLPKKIAPVNKDPQHYVVQYNETDFQFLSRLAVRFGEWFYYNGSELVFGEVGDSGVTLVTGFDLDRISVKSNVMPNNLNYSAYDYFKAEALNDSIKPLEGVANNTMSGTAAEASKTVFSRNNTRPVHASNVSNKNQLDQFKETDTNRIQANLLTVKGESKNPKLKTGCMFKVSSQGHITDYVATSVIHISNQGGHYENSFTAIPAGVKTPQYANPRIIRTCGVQGAIVKDNTDPDKMGRIKVQFPWQQSSDTTPWVRYVTPHAGADKGMYFIPEVGEEVIVDFDNDDVEKPYVLGSVYNGNAKPYAKAVSESDNNYKVIRTRGGNEIFFSDEAGKEQLLIANKDLNNEIRLHFADNQITIKSKGHIQISANSIDMKAEKNINIEAGEELHIKSGKIMELKTDDQFKVEAMKKIDVYTYDEMSIMSTKDALVASNMNLNLEGTQKASLKGIEIEISAGANLVAEGTATAKLSGAQVSVEGTGMAVVKAPLVAIN